MAVIHPPESAYAKEMIKWEAHPTTAGPGLRPYVKREFPAMWYKAKRVDGQLGIADTEMCEGERAMESLRMRGFFPTPGEAYDGVTAQEFEIAEASANRNWNDRNMSEKAKAESAKAESEASGHLAVVPEQPLPPKKPSKQRWVKGDPNHPLRLWAQKKRQAREAAATAVTRALEPEGPKFSA